MEKSTINSKDIFLEQEIIFYKSQYENVEIISENIDASLHYKDRRKKGVITKKTINFSDGRTIDFTGKHIDYAKDHNISRKIDLKFYENKAIYPDNIVRKKIEEKYLSTIELDLSGSLSSIEEQVKNKKAEIQAQVELECNSLKEAYSQESKNKIELFKKDLEEEFGVSDNPKKEKLYLMSWERGHSNGLYEVYQIYSELVELIY